MIGARAALIAALIAAPIVARAQSNDVAGALLPAVSAYRSGDLASAEAALRPLVAAGSADAMAWLGAVLIDRGASRDGLQLLQKAVDSGSSEGAQQLALAYAEGRGVPRDDGRALELLQKAASAGLHRAQLNLGTLYFRGQGTPRDLIQARFWLEKAASDNDPYALYALARAMDDSLGAAQYDPVRAGVASAQFKLANAYFAGAGVPRDQTQAMQWYDRAARQGQPEAEHAMGVWLLAGLSGVSDPVEGYKWLLLA